MITNNYNPAEAGFFASTQRNLQRLLHNFSRNITIDQLQTMRHVIKSRSERAQITAQRSGFFGINDTAMLNILDVDLVLVVRVNHSTPHSAPA